jgi:hypothetical protein
MAMFKKEPPTATLEREIADYEKRAQRLTEHHRELDRDIADAQKHLRRLRVEHDTSDLAATN